MKIGITIYCMWLLITLSACGAESPPTPSVSGAETISNSIENAVDTVEVSTQPPPTKTATAPVPTPTEMQDEITFIRTFGGSRRDRGINLLQTRDGGYVVVGYSSSLDAMQEDVYLVRIDPRGELLWSQTYGGEGKDNGWDVLEMEDGGFLIVGFTNSFGAGEMDIYTVRTDADGTMLWERTYGGPQSEFGWALAPAADGGFVLAGQTNSRGEGEEDGYIVKVDDEGDELWSQTFGGQQEDRLFSIDQGTDSGFILVGTTRSMGSGNRDLYLVKTNDSGEVAWTQVLGEERDDVGHAVRQTSDGGYVVTGYTKSFDADNYDTWLVKTDEAGILQWQKFFGESGDDRTIYGEQSDDGGFILTGYTTGFDSVGWDVFLVKADPSGDVSWHRTFGGNVDDTGYTVKQTADGGFILTGETYSFGDGGGDMILIKVNEDGEIME